MFATTVQVIVCYSVAVIMDIQILVNGKNCLQTGNRNGLPTFGDYRDGNVENDRIEWGHQAIIPSYKFDCDGKCGNITEWGVDVHPGGGNHQNVYTLDLQVWRPSPTVDDSTGTGQYSLVGNNRFTSISLSDAVAVVTPSPQLGQDYIQFQPGDVLGFYVDSDRDDMDGVVVLTGASFTSELVWFASIAPTLTTLQTTYSIGSSGDLDTLTRAAPVISISTVTFSCPRSPVATTLPTPPPQLTTDSNQTPPPTTQEPQQPTVPQETTNSPNNDNDQTQPLSNSEVVTTSGVVSGVPITSEAASEQQIDSGVDFGLVAGIVTVVVVLIVVVVTIIVAVTGLINKRKSLSIPVPTESNEAYGLTIQNDMDKITDDDDVYNYAEVVLDNKVEAKSEAYTTKIPAEGNVAYSTNVELQKMVIQENEAYALNTVTRRSEAYAPLTTKNEAHTTHISTEENVAYSLTNMDIQVNEAYTTNIVTETNEAYAPLENHSIYEN